MYMYMEELEKKDREKSQGINSRVILIKFLLGKRHRNNKKKNKRKVLIFRRDVVVNINKEYRNR